MKKIGIGVIGFGTVGTGVIRALRERRELFRRKAGVDLVLKKALATGTPADSAA